MPLRRQKCLKLVCGAVVCVVILSGSYLYKVVKESDCSSAESIQYLDSLCRNYSRGIVTGSLCKPLCEKKVITFKRCLGHGVKPHVLEVDWNGESVILKTKTLKTETSVSMTDGIMPAGVRKEDMKISVEQFTEHASRFLHLNMLKGTSPAEERTLGVVRNIISECDLGHDGVLSYWEVVTCWQLVNTAEYVLYSLLHDHPAALNVRGVCGYMYAVEYAVSAPFLGFSTTLSEHRSWKSRVGLALALLDMIEALENTTYGTLYLCDVQESNFGITRSKDGKLQAKAIDMDITMFEGSLVSQLQFERNRSCNVDDDCFMISCGSECNRESHRCAGILTSSNLVTICSRILMQRHKLHPALLKDPPHHIREKLNILLEKCSVYGHGHSHIDRYLLTQLKQLLHQSLG